MSFSPPEFPPARLLPRFLHARSFVDIAALGPYYFALYYTVFLPPDKFTALSNLLSRFHNSFLGILVPEKRFPPM